MEDQNSKRLESLAQELEKRRLQHAGSGGRNRRVRRWIRRLLMLLALVFFALASVFFVNFFRLNSDLIEGHIKQGIIPNLTQGLFKLEIGAISGNLLHGVELENVMVQNPHFETGANILTVPRVSMNYSLIDIFFGQLILQKLSIEDPVLTLRRNEKGRGIWDFSTVASGTNTASGSETIWQKRDKAQALADRYLADIRVKNLSILVPEPGKLIKDEFASRLIRLPQSTWQLNGVDLSLRKYPEQTFNSHLLRVAMPDKPDWLRFQVTTLKENGNFTVSFDALGQNFSFAVANIGQKGRKINFFDGRRRERLNLEWVWARDKISLPERIRGLTGVAHIAQLKDLVEGIFSEEHHLSGSVLAKFACAPDKPLYDVKASLELGSVSVKLPFLPVVRDLSTSVETFDRRADLKFLTATVASITSVHHGHIDFADEANIFTSLNSDLGGERLAATASYTRITPGSHRFTGKIERSAGHAEISFVRRLADKEIIYSDFSFMAGLLASGSAVDILPLKLLPASLSHKVLEYFSRVNLIGPFKITSVFNSLNDWRSSAVGIDFTGAKIISRANPSDCLALQGKSLLDAGLLKLDGFAATIDNLRLEATGSVMFIASSPFIENFDLHVNTGVTGSEPFAITSERLKASLGLKIRPDFDAVEISGQKFADFTFHDQNGCHGNVTFDRLRFVRRGKSLWAYNGNLNVEAGWRSGSIASGPGKIKARASLDFFGIPTESTIEMDLASQTLQSFSLTGGGANFDRMFAAFKTQPEGRALLKKYPFDLSGAFNFAVLGSGDLFRPALEGWLKFPALNLSMPGMSARLPFHVQLKTVADTYQASVKAGEAAIMFKDVLFDLGKTEASLQLTGVNASAGVSLDLQATSSIFGAGFKASGAIKPTRSKFENFKLNISSSKIETLASEIARIGRFVMPFSLSGNFEAAAELNGPLASPSSKGSVNVGQLSLEMPLFSGNAKTILSARQFSGQMNFDKRGDRLFAIDLKNLSGSVLDASVKIAGKAHLENIQSGFKPVIDGLNAEFNGLELKKLYGFLAAGLLPGDLIKVLSIDGGSINGLFNLCGTPQKIVATGSASLRDGALRFPALKDSVKKLNADFSFEGHADSGYARIGVTDLNAVFGRSVIAVSKGWLEDPLKSGKMNLKGRFDKVFPADLLALLGGLSISALTFPDEGWLDGNVELTGTLAKPLLKADIQSSAMTVRYDAGQNLFEIPLGKNAVSFSFNPGTGIAEVPKCELQLLGGSIIVQNASGRFLPFRPFMFNLDGSLRDIDFARFKLNDNEALKGLLSGKFKATWEEKGQRDAVFNLEFKNIHLPSLPLIDPQTLSKAGAEFIEKPDFKTGQLNFYVTTEEDDEFKGKLLIADGLFAGPHLRFEIGNSEFNPLAMQLDARLMINPQSLRQADIGQKLKKWTVTLQDEKTGIPYVDLSVGGTWEKPELFARAIKKKAERRVKRNFIGRIFGGHRPHKASAEELMQWFPGWKKGL